MFQDDLTFLTSPSTQSCDLRKDQTSYEGLFKKRFEQNTKRLFSSHFTLLTLRLQELSAW